VLFRSFSCLGQEIMASAFPVVGRSRKVLTVTTAPVNVINVILEG
jgi:hypothetical protein